MASLLPLRHLNCMWPPRSWFVKARMGRCPHTRETANAVLAFSVPRRQLALCAFPWPRLSQALRFWADALENK